MASPGSSPMRVTLERNDRRHELLVTQVTMENIRRLFPQVNHSEAYLKDSFSERSYVPQPDGSFDLYDLDPCSTLLVEGPIASNRYSRPSLSVSSTGPSSAVPSTPPIFRSVTAKKQMPTFSLKVVKAKLNKSNRRKPDFEPLSQTYIELVESTANLEHIMAVIHRRWGSHFTLVTSDGIELEESPAIQGLSFWKCPRRKIYAVSKKDLSDDCSISMTPKRIVLSDSDDDDFEPEKKKLKKVDKNKMDLIHKEVIDMKANISTLMSLSENTKIPLGLYRITRDTFQCTICHIVPVRPPVIVTKCCKTILGCDKCVNEWFSGPEALTKPCPSCRADRGYNETMLLRGLDGFLTEIRKVIQTEDERDEEEFPPVTLN